MANKNVSMIFLKRLCSGVQEIVSLFLKQIHSNKYWYWYSDTNWFLFMAQIPIQWNIFRHLNALLSFKICKQLEMQTFSKSQKYSTTHWESQQSTKRNLSNDTNKKWENRTSKETVLHFLDVDILSIKCALSQTPLILATARPCLHVW